MSQFDAFLRIIQRLRVVLRLGQYGAQLQLELALLLDLLHPGGHRVVLVEHVRVSRGYQLQTLLQVVQTVLQET